MSDPVFEYIKDLVPCSSAVKIRSDGQFLITVNSTYDYVYLNETGREIFLMCNGKNTVNDILAELENEYNADIEVIKEDLINIIRKLQCVNLIIFKRIIKKQ